MASRATSPPAEETREPEDKLGALVAALCRAQAKFQPVVKDQVVKAGQKTYSFAKLDSAIAATQPALIEEQLAVVQTFTTPAHEGIRLVTSLVHSGGGIISGELELNGAELGAQDVGSLITYARRYSYLAILGIAPEEDDDGARVQAASRGRQGAAGATNPPPTTRSAAPMASAPPAAQERPPGQLSPAWENAINDWMKRVATKTGATPAKVLGEVDGWLVHQAGGRQVLDLSADEAKALVAWLKAWAGVKPPADSVPPEQSDPPMLLGEPANERDVDDGVPW